MSELQLFMKEEIGQDMVEYTVLVGMIVVGVIATISTVASYVAGFWSNLASIL